MQVFRVYLEVHGSDKWALGGVTILLTHIRGLMTPLRTTHEPPSRALGVEGLHRVSFR